MRRLLTISTIVLCFMLVMPAPVLAFKVESGEAVQRTMEVVNPNVELREYQVIGSTAYLYITFIGSTDSIDIWKQSFLLKRYGIETIHVYVNSGGGTMTTAFAIVDIFERLKREGFKIITEAHGMVASAAVPVFLAGNTRIATKSTTFLLHPPKIDSYGFSSDTINTLKAKETAMSMMKDIYCRIVSKYSDLSTGKLSKLMEEDTWFTAGQAQEWGMVDELR
jgi:ATP-dependent protease ClpP protease subunit